MEECLNYDFSIVKLRADKMGKTAPNSHKDGDGGSSHGSPKSPQEKFGDLSPMHIFITISSFMAPME
jgi:hypothetical protein